MNLLEFVKVLFLEANMCSADFLMLLFLQTTAKFRDRKTSRVFPASRVHASQFWTTLKTLVT